MMQHQEIISAFGFESQQFAGTSIYAYAPVYCLSKYNKKWIVKRTAVRSSGVAIATWTSSLASQKIRVVAPASDFGENPRSFPSGKENTEEIWVVYPFIEGSVYQGKISQIQAAGELLGQIHGAGMQNDFGLKVNQTVTAIPKARVDEYVDKVTKLVRQYFPAAVKIVTAILTQQTQRYFQQSLPRLLDISLPLTNCSWDYKAENLIYPTDTTPVLVDPDHGGRIPRIYDLAIAVVLFHINLPTAPARMFTQTEWMAFLEGYLNSVEFTPQEYSTWDDVLLCAWIDQVLWLLTHWDEAWQDVRESKTLMGLLTADLTTFALSYR